ncbi:PREDICTED: uncharacterized protein LOC104596427 [Nelumbo nucifera]|uniref:Uncharacterized protein LOC104596427 n=1 Tax=Nelumbo nucifera TaxID=4432 RepID=A0A1U7ZR25_NELNU|nr:PREDICTED: uncharacterized protein LOC104596427 [Nelumbo nucifera]
MPEKGVNPVFHPCVFWPNAWLQKRFPILTGAVFLGMLIIWSIGGCTIRDRVSFWRNRQDYLTLKLQAAFNHSQDHDNLTYFSNSLGPVNRTDSHTNLIHKDHDISQSPASPPQSEVVSHQNVTAVSDEKPHQSLTHLPTLSNFSWISVQVEPNLTSNLLSRWLDPGGEPCRDSRTVDIRIPGLDDQKPVELSAGKIHEFVIQALDQSGKPRCLGGDYFETDLSGESWKTRPPVRDLGNGSYSLSLQVHPNFTGEYNLTVILLFRHFEGLKFSPHRFAYDRELRRIPVKFYRSNATLPQIRTCRKSDFSRDVWSGRWTRHGKNDDCKISNDGRYRCLNLDFPCQKPWCEGSLGSLESNGWVYSTHCAFRIFIADSAWKCLQNRWIFFWGDSNHVDTIRNLLNFVFDLPEIKAVPRRFDMNFTNPRNRMQTVRITSIFNGHWNETQNYEGLNSLQDEEYRNLLKRYFSEETVPDTIVMNSGLHDGVHWKNVRRFTQGAEYAARFWKDVIESVKGRGKRAPEVVYRTTIATGGYARVLAFNPSKMEVFNGVLLEKLKGAGIVSGVIDDFDMTFPWHYDNRCNDGVHYGRAPAKLKWRDGEIGHQYFVDLMLCHVILNALCAR